MREIFSACREAGRRGEAAVLATVVKVSGSTYRRPGARMLFRTGLPPLGFVSGGCLEADLAERARAVFASGGARTVVYDMRSPDDIVWGLGLGCEGEVRVLLERLTGGAEAAYLEFLEDCAAARRPAVVATVFDANGHVGIEIGARVTLARDGAVLGPGGALQEAVVADAQAALASGRTTVRRYALPRGGVEVLIEYVAPTVRLVLFGAGQDLQPVAQAAGDLGWDVVVVDHREPVDVRALAIDKQTAVIVMTHHFLHDVELMAGLLPTPARYLGFLGPRKRLGNLLSALAERGTVPTAEQLARVYGPVGIDIGAETPEEIALSALAEIRAVMAGRTAGFLRDRTGPLHDP